MGLGDLKDRRIPTEIEAMAGVEIHYINSGKNHSAFIDSKMEIYSWGYNKYGQLGLNHFRTPVPIPTKVSFGQSVTKIRCGYKNSLILTKEFECYSCGDNNGNSVTVEDVDCVASFRLVPNLPEIEKIFCTNFFAALTKDNCVFVWGHTPLWQFTQPYLLEEFRDRTLDVSIGNDFMVVIDFNFLVYSAGKNDKGQLGYENTIENIDFKCVERLSTAPMKLISCGADFCLGLSGINPKTLAGQAEGQITPVEPSPRNNTLSKSVNIFQNARIRDSTMSQTAAQLQSPDFPQNVGKSMDINSSGLFRPRLPRVPSEIQTNVEIGKSVEPSPVNRPKVKSTFSNMPQVFEKEEDLGVKHTFAQNALILNKKPPKKTTDFSKERAEIEEIERLYLERITPRGFQREYLERVDELRVG